MDCPMFQQRINQAWKKSGLTKKEFAREFGVGVSTMERWLSGDTEPLEPMQKLIFECLDRKR